MSGIKDVTVTMTRSERDRLFNSARMAEESKEQALYREQLSQNALNAANMKLETLNRTLNNEIAGLHEDFRNMANEQNRHFREQADEYNKRIQRQEFDFNSRLENQKVELQNSINDVRQGLQNQINKIAEKEKHSEKQAELWISQTQAYFNDIEQYRHEMFTPGQLEKLKGKLKQVYSSINNNMYEAATATAMGLFNDAVDLKVVVLNAETEWLYYHGLFLRTLANTEANLNSCNNLQFTFEMEHGAETVDANVNYWTNGVLDEVSASISEVKQKTEQIQSVSIQQLIGYIDTLNQQNVKMKVASEEAKKTMFLSQERAEMANKLADALEEVMWKCERITYEGGEQNQPVHVKLSDGMGNEIVAIITPEIDAQNMANKLKLNFFDKKNDERQRQAWITSIQNSLKQDGLVVGEAKCVPGYEDKPSDKVEIRDIDATARRVIERSEIARHKTSGK